MITQVCDLGDINSHKGLCEQDPEHSSAERRTNPLSGHLAFDKHHSGPIPAKPKVRSIGRITYNPTVVDWVPISESCACTMVIYLPVSSLEFGIFPFFFSKHSFQNRRFS